MEGRSDTRGFTLIEMLISIIVLAILGSAAVVFLMRQNQTLLAQNDGTLTSQNARAGVELLVREVRNAGYDGRGTGAGLSRMDPDTVAWTADLNGDGDFADVGAGWAENVRYAFVEDTGELWREAGGTSALVLTGLDSLRFDYLDGDGNVAVGSASVEQVRIRIWYPTPDGVLPGEIETQVALRNNIYD